MPRIQVLEGNNTVLGSGEGVIDAKARKASITSWITKARLRVSNDYKLKSKSKTFSAHCAEVNTTSPVARFDEVE